MPRQGRHLEQIVEFIERVIGGRDNVTVESPKYLPDMDTGQPREFDVVVTIKGGHHEIVIAIECKDWQRQVGVPEVEQFVQKCERAPVHHRVMVSASGFHETALTKAKASKVRCLTLQEVGAFDWCLTNVIHQVHRRVSEVWVHSNPVDPPPRGTPLTLYTEDGSPTGRPMKNDEIAALVNQRLNMLPPTLPDDDRREFKCDLDTSRVFFLTDAGQRVALRSAEVRVKFIVETVEVPLAFHEYAEAGSEEPITRAAFAPIKAGNSTVHVALVQDKSGDIRVMARMVPTKND